MFGNRNDGSQKQAFLIRDNILFEINMFADGK